MNVTAEQVAAAVGLLITTGLGLGLRALLTAVVDIRDKVRDIHATVFGHKDNPSDGLIARVRRIEERHNGGRRLNDSLNAERGTS